MARGWGAGQVYGDEAEKQAQLRAELAGAGVDPMTLDPGLAPAQKAPTADMFTPNWGIERPPLTAMSPEEALAYFGGGGGGMPSDPEREAMRAALMTPGGPGQSGYPVAPLPPAQSGTFPQGGSASPGYSGWEVAQASPGYSGWGTLGGFAGLGGGQAQTSGLQSQSGYRPGGLSSSPAASWAQGPLPRGSSTHAGPVGGSYGNSATPYGMNRQSPTPYGGGGWSTLGAFGFGRR